MNFMDERNLLQDKTDHILIKNINPVSKTKLSVNVNKIATLRNARGNDIPNLVRVVSDCERFGAEGITVHPRPDERHIRYQDVYDLKKIVRTEFNIEGKPDKRFMDLVLDIIPEQCTLVPDAPNALTSNSGWDTLKHAEFLTEIVKELKDKGIRVSIFIDPLVEMVEEAAKTGADRIELYTESYAHQYNTDKIKAVKSFVNAAYTAQKMGLGVNAGHDLNLENLAFFKNSIPNLLEVSIGHALISDALNLGLENTIRLYQRKLNE